MITAKSKPGICVLLARLCRILKRMGTSNRARLGLLFLVLNFPIGYGGIAAGLALSASTGNKLWTWLGTACYGLSWAMLFTATALLGAQAKNLLQTDCKRCYRAWNYLRSHSQSSQQVHL